MDEFDGLDILVACAGGNLDRLPVEESDINGWTATLDVNLVGPDHCAKSAIPHMRQRGAGKIIIIGSGGGHRGYPGTSADACSKAGLWMLTRVLAQELSEYWVSVNELIPGPVMTERAREIYGDGGHPAFDLPGEWVKDPEDVTSLALFLATQPDVGPTAQSFSLMRRDT